MEPWFDGESRKNKKSLRRKILEVTIVVYAGFAIFFAGIIAESITIPLAAKRKRAKERHNEGS